MAGPDKKIPTTIDGTVRRLGCWGKLGIIVLVLIVLEAALQILFQYQRRCPPVSGIIVDRDTGEPIAGAVVSRQMLGRSRNPIYGLAGSSGPGPILPFGLTKTDRQGEFSFSPAKTMMRPSESGDPLIYLYGPNIREGLEIIVYAPDYIPARSNQEGFIWEKEQWLTLDTQKTKTYSDPQWHIYGPTGFSVSRKGSLRKGFTYSIKMVKAVTQEQWEEKCHATMMLASKYMWGDIANEWLFNDLIGYLERWPEGEKAGEYYRLVWETAAFRSCDYMRQDLTSGELTKDQLTIYCERGSRIISIAKTFSSPPGGMDRDGFLKELQRHEESISCAKTLLEEKHPSNRGGGK